jgi:hypothetical protein
MADTDQAIKPNLHLKPMHHRREHPATGAHLNLLPELIHSFGSGFPQLTPTDLALSPSRNSSRLC